jgi:hypothetical protein
VHIRSPPSPNTSNPARLKIVAHWQWQGRSGAAQSRRHPSPTTTRRPRSRNFQRVASRSVRGVAVPRYKWRPVTAAAAATESSGGGRKEGFRRSRGEFLLPPLPFEPWPARVLAQFPPDLVLIGCANQARVSAQVLQLFCYSSVRCLLLSSGCLYCLA